MHIDLAKEVVDIVDNNKKPMLPIFAYHTLDSIKEKIADLCKNVYGIDPANIRYSKDALKFISRFDRTYENHEDEFINEIYEYPICMAKTQYSFSDDAKNLLCLEPFKIHVKNVILKTGAGFIVILTGNIFTMPGLPKVPAAERIDVDENGIISGLF